MAITSFTAEQLENLLKPIFVQEAMNTDVEWLTVRDDSASHHGHAGAAHGGHFQVDICSERFQGLSRMARHRLVYDQVQPWMQNGIHALQIRAITPAECENSFDKP